MRKGKLKYVFVSGGVLSGVGKGITTASLALLLKSRGFKVTAAKCDMYLNIDAGTMNPVEHGEVFVTEDRVETDQDVGHYERFLDQNIPGKNYITSGQIYWNVLERERSFGYEGKTVDAYEEIPEEIIRRIKKAGRGYEIIVVEMGGTVGEYQNIMFYEAIRRLKLREPDSTVLVHIGYLPFVKTLGEIKAKPLKMSISGLHSLGLQPDFVIARAEKPIDRKRKEKIAFDGALSPEDVISNPDAKTVYHVPLILEAQNLPLKILKKLKLKPKKQDLRKWKAMVKRTETSREKIKIGIIAKYISSDEYTLEDSYICVNEALKHASWHLGFQPEIVWFDAEEIEKKGIQILEKNHRLDGILVPQGWGSRGTEGKILSIHWARIKKIPFLGLCFGMQMAVIEIARYRLGWKDANSYEVNPKTSHPVVHLMPDQEKYLKKKQYGGTIRLGAWPARVKRNTLLAKIYGKTRISERHRHRYEFNNLYRKAFMKAGVVFSALSPDNKLVEAMELKQDNHPFFLGVQFHPELKSRPLVPHPIFLAFIQACIRKKQAKQQNA